MYNVEQKQHAGKTTAFLQNYLLWCCALQHERERGNVGLCVCVCVMFNASIQL